MYIKACTPLILLPFSLVVHNWLGCLLSDTVEDLNSVFAACRSRFDFQRVAVHLLVVQVSRLVQKVVCNSLIQLYFIASIL